MNLFSSKLLMNPTQLAAWIGACTGVASLAWNIYVKLTEGPKLIVSARPGMKRMPPRNGNPDYLSITVSNTGTDPTTLKNLSLHVYASKRRKNMKKARSFVIATFEGPQLPHKLEVGGEWRVIMKQAGDFDQLLSTGRLWCAVHHSFSKRPVQSKVEQLIEK
jgi:hypothetical protein